MIIRNTTDKEPVSFSILIKKVTNENPNEYSEKQIEDRIVKRIN